MTSCFQMGFSAKRWHPFSPPSGSEHNWTNALLCVTVCGLCLWGVSQREERKVVFACAYFFFSNIVVRQCCVASQKDEKVGRNNVCFARRGRIRQKAKC